MIVTLKWVVVVIGVIVGGWLAGYSSAVLLLVA